LSIKSLRAWSALRRNAMASSRISGQHGTKALRDLVRKAARLESKRPSEFLRQAAEEKARAVIAARAREDLRAMLERLPPAGPTTTTRPSAWVPPWVGWPGAGRGEDGPRVVGPGSGARDAEPRLGVAHHPGGGGRRCRAVGAVVAVADRVLAGEAKGLVARDPADDMVLAAAIGGRADWVVSLDRHLNDLAEVERVRILRPGDFLVELRTRGG